MLINIAFNHLISSLAFILRPIAVSQIISRAQCVTWIKPNIIKWPFFLKTPNVTIQFKLSSLPPSMQIIVSARQKVIERKKSDNWKHIKLSTIILVQLGTRRTLQYLRGAPILRYREPNTERSSRRGKTRGSWSGKQGWAFSSWDKRATIRRILVL